MRLLCCLLLGCSTLLSGCGESQEDVDTSIKKPSETVTSDEQPRTTNNLQDAAVAAIKKLGGRVTFDEENPGKPVIGLDLLNTKVADAGLAHLKGLTKLQSLNLGNTKVTDAGLEHLKGLTNLRELHLYDTMVTDAGLAAR